LARKSAKILMVALILGALLRPGRLPGEEISPYGNPLLTLTLGGVQVKAEVVQSPEKIYLGLSYRPELPEGQGMLFLMPGLEVQYFCMRGMQFPLDIIWIKEGWVTGLAKNVPADFSGQVASPGPVDRVLEVPAGFSDRQGIRVGDPVKW
jgi:uncharacterized membrane protein (UPF0127 family)